MSTKLTRNQFCQYLRHEWRRRILVIEENGRVIAIPIQRLKFINHQLDESMSIHSSWYSVYRDLGGWENFLAQYESKSPPEDKPSGVTDEQDSSLMYQYTNRFLGWRHGEWYKYKNRHEKSLPLTDNYYVRVHQHTDNIISWESGGKRKHPRAHGFIVTQKHFAKKLRTPKLEQLTFADIKPEQLILKLGL